MKISYNWLQDYLNINMPPEQLAEILTDIGLEVEGIETYESLQGGLEGVVIGEVTFKDKHPNADKLSITKVDIGTEILDIVCGAPNVAQGQKVVVATVGTTLYPTEGEPFVMKKGKIRGEVSNGMICAEDELGLGTSHEGILVLPSEIPVGTPAADYFDITRDTIFEIGLTPNRSDATSHIGVAKDLFAALQINHNYKQGICIPSTRNFKQDDHTLDIKVTVENSDQCPRYAGVTLTNIQVAPSPEWLQHRLRAIGVRPINNIVDITNYVLHEFGQPLHAFDTSKIENQHIIVKNLPSGSPFVSLDGVERTLHQEDLMICDDNSNGMCIAGVFGGENSGVTEATTSIFLESAHFDAGSIRRTSMRHLLRTDAAKVFEKGSDPSIVVQALKRAATMMQEMTGAKISSPIIDIYPKPFQKANVEISYSNVRRLIGVDIPSDTIKDILAALEINILTENEEKLTLAIPTNKAEVLREADVIEEILRIYGLNKIPVPSQVKSSLSFSQKPDAFTLRNKVASLLAANGFNEIMSLSITQSKYFDESQHNDLIFINNTSNMHLDVMRPSLLHSGLESIIHNQNRQNADLRFFEFGKHYLQGDDKYQESEYFAIFLTGNKQHESWINPSTQQADFYTLKAYTNLVFDTLGLSKYQVAEATDADLAYGLKYHRGKQVLAEFGKVSNELTTKFGIKNPVLYASINWEEVLKSLKNHNVTFEDINKFPRSRRDLALVVNKDVTFEQIKTIAQKIGKKILTEVNLFDVYADESKLGEGKKSYAVSFIFEDSSKTLKDKDLDKVMQKIIATCEKQLQAIIRK